MPLARGTDSQNLVDRTTLLKALIHVADYTFPDQRLTRSHRANGNFVKYTIKVGDRRGSEYTFLFESSDWIFDWPNLRSSVTAGDIITRLDWQFERVYTSFYASTRELNRAYSGLLHVNPLPLYSKVCILRSGRYYFKAAIVISNVTRNLKVLVEEVLVVSISQDYVRLLDPEHTLPFGIPIASNFRA